MIIQQVCSAPAGLTWQADPADDPLPVVALAHGTNPQLLQPVVLIDGALRVVQGGSVSAAG